MRRLTAALLTALCLATPATARAQSPGSGPLFDQLTHTFKRDWLSVGLLLQIVADGQIERTMPGQNGFSVANARLGLSGRLDGGFSYALQTALTRSPAILDAKLGYRLGSWGTVEVGRFKAPFSRERLTSAAGIDFVNRSQVVTALSPGRQVGAQLLGRLLHGRLEYGAGAFNGNGLASGNDNQHLMYTGRVSWWAYGDPAAGPADRRLEIAVNAAGSRDDAAAIGGLVPSFRGSRTLLGADARWRRGRMLLAGEVIHATLDSLGGGSHSPVGWHTTAGWYVRPATQLLARWDVMRRDGLGPRSDWLVLGLNRWPTRATEIQVNWIMDLHDADVKHSQLLVNMQVGF